jgi:hypothetical protein
MNHTTETTDYYPPTASKRVIGPALADCPEDGGKWAIWCEHFDANGEPIYCGVTQDSNKARLRPWKNDTASWCGLCWEESRGGNNYTFHNPYAS